VDGGTTGGGDAEVQRVTSMSELRSLAGDSTPRVLELSGTFETGSSALEISSNKTLVGAGEDTTIIGGITINGQSNIIIRNLSILGAGEGGSPADSVGVRGSQNLWFDHLNITDGPDGILDLTRGTDHVTVSWSKFYYTDSNQSHRLALLFGGGSTHDDTDTGKNNHTVHHNWFGDLVDQRMPRLLFGKGHIYNNYYNSPGNSYCIGSGSYASLLVENNYFKDVNDPHRFQDSNPSTITAEGNIYDNVSGKRETGGNTSDAPAAWTNPPYNYTLDAAESIPELVQRCAGPQTDISTTSETDSGTDPEDDSGSDTEDNSATDPAEDSGTDPIADYTYCSSENETCTYSGTVDIAYGADGQFNYLQNQSSGSVSCDNETFGDPVYGTVKACYVKLVSTVTDPDGNADTDTEPVDVADNNTGVTSLKSLADFPIGIAVNAGNESNSFINSSTSAQQQSVVFPHFDQLTAGNIMKMSYLHPSEDSFTFDQADELVSFAQSNGMGVHGHTLIWHSDYQVPEFMKNYSGDFAAMLKEHVQTIASHFAGKVDSWDVVNEAIADDDSGEVHGLRNSVFYQKMGVDYIDQAFINARAADPQAELFYNDYSIENGGTKTDNMLSLVDGLIARDVPITGVGFQMHVLVDWPDVSVIEQAMRNVADRGLKVKITELDVRVNNPYNSSAPVYSSLTEEAASRQKERYNEIVAAYLRAVPASLRAGISVWGVWDADSWLNTADNPDWPLLFDDNFQPKPALQGFADALTSQ
jgi:endo-1,4-beta-xylanase